MIAKVQIVSRFSKCKKIFLQNIFFYFVFSVILCTFAAIRCICTMALNLNKNLKLYYSIKEVADMFGVNESTLRYWEQEFPYLKPKTSGPSKIRQYQEKDIEQIRLIHNLVKVRGFKLAAAKKIINSNRDGADKKAEVLTKLISIRAELQALKKQMDYLE